MLAPSYLSESKHTLVNELADGLESNALSWLSGYFAGVAQGRQANRPAPAPVAALAGTSAAKQLTIVYGRSEEHTSELQSLMRISYAVFCLQKKKIKHI